MSGAHQSQANRGRSFEDFLKVVHARYQKSGIACVHKVPTEFIPLRNGTGAVMSCKVEEKSCVDYLGRWCCIPVAVEAKHTEARRISFDRVEPHQAAYLDDFCRSAEAVGLVLVSFGLRRFFAVPWPAWKAARDLWMLRRSRTPALWSGYGWKWYTPGMASVSPEQLLPEWEIRQGGLQLLPYLDIVREMTRRI